MNAAVWLGVSVFWVFGVGPAVSSPGMKALLGVKFYPFFSEAILELMATRCCAFQIACAVIALLHLATQWLYLGRATHRLWIWLLTGLLLATVLNAVVIQPRLKTSNAHRFDMAAKPEVRAQASQAFVIWSGFRQGIDLLCVAGLIIYCWRVGNPPNETRFISSNNFRG